MDYYILVLCVFFHAHFHILDFKYESYFSFFFFNAFFFFFFFYYYYYFYY